MPVYRNKARNSWYCSFYYTDWTGKRKRKKKEGFSSRKEAKDYETAFLAQRHGCCDMVFETLANLYLEDCRNHCKPTSLYTKNYLIETKILPYFKDMPVNEIKVSTVRSWQNNLLSQCSIRGQAYSDAYLKSIHVQLSAILNYGMRYYNLSFNPAALCGSMGHKKAAVMNFWTIDEFHRFLSCLEPEPLPQLIFQLLFWTGIRSGELLALSADHFDFKKHSLRIVQNYCRFQGRDLLLAPKTVSSLRTIALPAFLCNEIQAYVSGLPNCSRGSRLFPVSKYYLTKSLKSGCAKSGVKEIRIHDLRHSHASLLIELGYSPLLIAERLGHEKIETTLQTYAHLYPNKQSELAAYLEDIHKQYVSGTPSGHASLPNESGQIVLDNRTLPFDEREELIKAAGSCKGRFICQ